MRTKCRDMHIKIQAFTQCYLSLDVNLKEQEAEVSYCRWVAKMRRSVTTQNELSVPEQRGHG